MKYIGIISISDSLYFVDNISKSKFSFKIPERIMKRFCALWFVYTQTKNLKEDGFDSNQL